MIMGIQVRWTLDRFNALPFNFSNVVVLTSNPLQCRSYQFLEANLLAGHTFNGFSFVLGTNLRFLLPSHIFGVASTEFKCHLDDRCVENRAIKRPEGINFQ